MLKIIKLIIVLCRLYDSTFNHILLSPCYFHLTCTDTKADKNYVFWEVTHSLWIEFDWMYELSTMVKGKSLAKIILSNIE